MTKKVIESMAAVVSNSRKRKANIAFTIVRTSARKMKSLSLLLCLKEFKFLNGMLVLLS
jgi:hypothetical protein